MLLLELGWVGALTLLPSVALGKTSQQQLIHHRASSCKERPSLLEVCVRVVVGVVVRVGVHARVCSCNCVAVGMSP